MMAVVGPNGCGKSNVVDAIRWVLGEQRTGALRAEKMEEVVFNGTKSRRPVGMSEVTLTIENDKKLLPVVYSEVEITRRLYRSGESEYLINRQPSRLKDVQGLFADTGFHSNAYSIIELQMVEGIITGPSTVRRALLEEAAGIAGFKVKRRATELKLNKTRDHLTRIDDIHAEVEKQYNSLKRQATRAKRYKVIERAIQLRLIADLSGQRFEITDRLGKTEPNLAEVTQKQESLHAEIERIQHLILSLEAKEMTLNDKINRAQDTLKRLDRREAEMNRDVALIDQRLTFLETEQGSIDERRETMTKSLSSAEEQLKVAQADKEKLAKERENAAAKLTEFEQQSGDFRDKLVQLRKQLDEAQHKESEAQRNLARETEQQSGRRSERHRLDERLLLLETELANIKLSDSEDDEQRKEIQTALSKCSESVSVSRDQLDRLGKDLNATREEHDNLLSLRAKSAAELEAAAASVRAHRTRSGSTSDHPDFLREWIAENKLLTLSDRLECEPEHQLALYTLLKPILESFDAKDFNTVIGFADKFKSGQQAVFRVESETYNSLPSIDLPTQFTACTYIPNLIRNDDELGNFLRHRLSDTVLVPDRGMLKEMESWARENHIRLVTPLGDLYEPDGIFHAGSVDPEALQIGWKSKLAELEAVESELRQRLQTISDETKSAEARAIDLKVRLEKARNDHRSCEDDLAKSQRELDSFENGIVRAQKRFNSLKADKEKVEKQIAEFDTLFQRDDMLNQLREKVAQAGQLRSELSRKLNSIDSQRLDLADKRASLSAESARLSERYTALNRSIARFTDEVQTHRGNLASLEASITEGQQKQKQSLTAKSNLTTQIDLLSREKSAVTEDYDAAKEQYAELKTALESNRRAVKDNQSQTSKLLEKRSRWENEIVELRQRLRDIDRRLVEDAQIDPDSVTQETSRQSEEELQEIKLDDVSLERLKTRLQALGAVNLLALDELDETEERYNSLSEQKKDLEDGVELLEELISKMDVHAQSAFKQTFDLVNKYFYEIFNLLFEGGDARLVLEDDDPFQADIRILATPSGKKLQGLSMLSGGEKTLTALALLFAVYQVRPSPFCILDEVDAPLDDINIGRFTKMIHKYSQETQFLIVTHNKRTMEAADNLYGITLAEDGTSRTISVRLEEVQDGVSQ